MKLFELGFLSFRLVDLADILLVALLIYALFRLLRGSLALNVFFGFISVYLVWYIVKALNMRVLSTVLGQVISVGVIGLLIVFQQEIRRFLLLMGQGPGAQSGMAVLRKWLPFRWRMMDDDDTNFYELAAACVKMSQQRLGAIMVLARSSELKLYAATGTPIDGELTEKLLMTIFNKKSPLHDGAVIIVDGKIRAAGCILPVSERSTLPSYYGLRHRSAMGMAETTDSLVVVVSEESGRLTLFSKGVDKLIDHTDPNLKTILQRAYAEE